MASLITTEKAYSEAIAASHLAVLHFLADWAPECATVTAVLEAAPVLSPGPVASSTSSPSSPAAESVAVSSAPAAPPTPAPVAGLVPAALARSVLLQIYTKGLRMRGVPSSKLHMYLTWFHSPMEVKESAGGSWVGLLGIPGAALVLLAAMAA